MKKKPYTVTHRKQYIPQADVIREFRLSKGYTLKATSVALGISITYLARIENGEMDGISAKVAGKLDLLFSGKIVP